jgi:hypothetical protein
MLPDLGITNKFEIHRSHWAIKEVNLFGALRQKDIVTSHLESEPSLQAVPAQIPQAFVFGGNEGDPITLIDPPGDQLNDTTDQRETHADIREKANLLLKACGSSNRLAILSSYLSRLLAASGAEFQDLQARRFWQQMNSLRRRAEADERIRASADPEEPALPETIAGALLDLVDTLNVFAAFEPKLAELDELRSDPSERAITPETVQAAQHLAAAAGLARDVISPDAASNLTDAAAETSGDTPATGRAKQFLIRSARNLAIETIRRTYKFILHEGAVASKEMRAGAYRMSGQLSIMYTIAIFIQRNEAAVRTLIDTLGGGPTLQRIVDLIVKWIG